jgi:class 3 adenylate cyclase
MLERVIPAPVVKQLSEGIEHVSFAVQSASIGFIMVTPTSPGFADKEFDDQMQFFNNVYMAFDCFMEDYHLLAKVRTAGNVYVYAGGLFGSVNKPEKHAEEATRFALQLIQEIETIAAKAGEPLELTMGLNTGGPLAAGVVGLNRPAFQLIGPPFEIAEQLMLFGIPMQLQITRSVYELIYAHNFRVTERGEIKVQFDRMLATYVIEV